MRRQNRVQEKNNFSTIVYVVGSVVGIAVLVFIIGFVLLGGNNSNQNEGSKLSTAKIENLVPNNTAPTNTNAGIQQASTQIGKSVNEVQNTMNNTTNVVTTTVNETTASETSNKKANEAKLTNSTTAKENTNKEPKTTKQEDKAPVFEKPVNGEIIREYAKDKLVYSETLKEWITHPGVDIKAEKTSVVKAAADGRVSSIKNDPRYGLTVTIEHQAGFKTVYSNLLTAEFVTEGEEVTSGQTIGTVGNTATFEILDDDHLHFEILKDNENVDPGIYIQ